MGTRENTEEIVMTAVKRNGQAMMRMERKKKKDINLNQVHHIAGGPYKGILVNKQADTLDTVDPPEGRVEFMAYLIHADRDNAADRWTLRFWFRGQADGVSKKKIFTDYFSELINPKNLPRKYVGFVKRALVLLQSYQTVKRLELEVEEVTDVEEDLPPIKSFVSVFTPDSYTYRFVPEVSVDNKTFLTFKIKAKCDAQIALCAIYGSVERKAYEICLGAEDNSKSFIRDGSLGPVKSEAKTINLLSESDFHYFWLSWANNKVEVGKGAKYGHARFLCWDVPANRQFKVNSMAVATSRATKGHWEFAEIIDEKDFHRESKRNKIKLSLLWLAKKQKMLQILEDAYPNNMSTDKLFKTAKVKKNDSITAVVMLKDLEKKGLIKEVEKGIWLRMQTNEETVKHEVLLVQDLPTLSSKEQPTIGIITGLYQEKLAVDAMIENKRTYVKYKTEASSHNAMGESQVYTIGKIGHHHVVSTKLAKMGEAEGDIIAAENTVTRLLGTFNKIQHVLLVGVGGAVPHYSDYTQHVRLGDVVVSTPADDSGAIYIYCSKVDKMPNSGGFNFSTRIFSPREKTLINAANKIKKESESTISPQKTWEKFIEEGKDILRGQESHFHRPMIKRDKLFLTKSDGSVVQVDHPRPLSYTVKNYKEGQTNIRYGVVGCGQSVAKTEPQRREFAQLNGIKAFHQEHDFVLESVEGNRCDSYLVILGMCDYEDGSKKEWTCYAALAAAAYMKSLLLTL
ncbi:hypothetical protein BgiMline_021599 [Biomphalaria glabrata]|uniref:Uncharacterized protein LOC106067883 isoform X1 n=1 Tax=Biomphalaria glabrata TaxID=6526 RepID=A0A9W3B3F8_BIOGL|nr:uncharacterized protein LOC106067883 isoform X1 [Biomphalaria glabrata]XP_055893992.1 uncharacterized protein LOC106067883 isoform X1 [Biomphalaria glabrata]